MKAIQNTSNPWRRWIAWFVEHLYAIVPGIVGFAVAMSIAFSRWPEPYMHDDFGNLLVASTLLEGRFSNPVPAAWQSLETFHVILQPTYASKYPIGLGAMMALGKLGFGTCAAGLWLCAGLASWSIAWMVAGHLPRRWAAFAGLFAATHPYWQNGWSQEYTNGWLSVAGVSMVLGGLLRVRRIARGDHSHMQRASSAIAMIGLGCALNLFSRPFEGGVVCGLLGLLCIPTWISRQLYLVRSFWSSAVGGTMILVAGIVVQLCLNQAITLKWHQLPYQLHELQYGVAPVLIWQKPHEPSLGHRFEEQRRFHRGWSMDAYRTTASWHGYLRMLQRRLIYLANHWGNFLAFAPIGLVFLPKERRHWIGFVGVLPVALLVINCIPWCVPQYVSPLIPIALFVGCCSTRGLLRRIAKKAVSIPDSRPVFLESIVFGVVLWMQCTSLFGIALARSQCGPGWETTWSERRAAILKDLQLQAGNDLVLVRYSPDHDVLNEWVFNHADVSNAEVVWARWGSDALNKNLLKNYPGRRHWLLEWRQGVPSLSELPTDKN